MFDQPISFKEADQALARRKDKTTYMKSREIALAWNADARARAFFSARVANATILSELHNKVEAVIKGQMTTAQAHNLIRRYFAGEGADALAELGFAPPREATGMAQLASVNRVQLIIETNVRMAQEVGQYKQWAAQRDIYQYGIWKCGYSKEHRQEHLARDGKAYAFDHPIWTQSPPGGEFNCHCYRLLVREEDVQERSITPERLDIPFEPSSLGFNPARGIRKPPEFGKRVRKEYKDIAKAQMAQFQPEPEKPVVAIEEDVTRLPIQEALAKRKTVAETLQKKAVDAVERINSRNTAVIADIDNISNEIKDIIDNSGGNYTDETRSEIHKLQAKRKDSYTLLDKIRNESYIELSRSIAVPVEERLSIQLSVSKTSAIKNLVDQAKEAMEQVISQKSGLSVKNLSARAMRPNSRSYCDLSKNEIVISSDAKIPVVVHEMAHWVENSSTHVHNRCVEFLDYRCAGETSLSLRTLTGDSRFKSYERARKDNFFSPYCGKDYVNNGNRYATEVLSMGLQRVIEDPVNFAKEDTEYFNFVILLVRGEI